MKYLFSLMMVLALLFNGAAWAKKKSSDELDSSGKSSKHHSHKKGSKGSKGSDSKSGEGFNSESEINKKDVTFNFEDNKKGKKKGKSKKKKQEEPSDIPLEDSK